MRRLAQLLFALTFALVCGATATASDGTRVFSDGLGDAHGGPDIAAVIISTDPAGTVTMWFDVWLPVGGVLMVALDANADGRDDAAVDRAFMIGREQPGRARVAPFRGSATGKPVAARPRSLKAKVTSGSITISFSRTELRIGRSFLFHAEARSHAMIRTGKSGDLVPDGGCSWRYTLPGRRAVATAASR